MIERAIYKPIDVKAEVLIAELLERKRLRSIDDLAIQPDGGFNHTVSRDIRNVSIAENEHGLQKMIFTVSRTGLYDVLPSGLFHDVSTRPTAEDSDDSSQALIQKLRDRRAEEVSARKFFSPFDQAINRYRLELEQEERSVLTGFPIEESNTLFDIIWGDFGGIMSGYQKSILFSLLPLSNHIIGEDRYTELSYEAVLGIPVTINRSITTSKINDEGENRRLNNLTLSEDFVLGQASDEVEDQYIIEVGPIPIGRCTEFLPNAKGAQLLDTLSGYFIPLESHVEYTYAVLCEPLQLDNPENQQSNTGRNRLGYSIQI